MTEQFDLLTVPESPLPALEAARRRIEVIESAPPCYLKFTVDRTSMSEIYVRVAPGTKPKDVPQAVIKSACRKMHDSDWGFGSDHDYSAYNGKPCDAKEAETYAVEDATGIKCLRAEVARLEKESIRK